MVRSLMPMFLCSLLCACSAAPADTSANTGNAARVDEPVANLPVQASEESEDAKVAGTDYDAVTEIPCGMDQELDARCHAGVKRNGGPDSTSFVEVTRPDGTKRVLFFQGSNASGADSNEADGSSKYRFLWHREDDWTVIRYGPERYRVPDALVIGG